MRRLPVFDIPCGIFHIGLDWTLLSTCSSNVGVRIQHCLCSHMGVRRVLLLLDRFYKTSIYIQWIFIVMFHPFKRRKVHYKNWVDATKEGLCILRGDIVQLMIHPFPLWSQCKYSVISSGHCTITIMDNVGCILEVPFNRIILYKRNSFKRF